MNITFATLSSAGPRPVNEDCLDCWIADTGEIIACVADGLGGMGGGDIASNLAVHNFKEFLSEGPISSASMMGAARSSHEAIRIAQGEGYSRRMATTMTAIALKDGRIIGVHCGDTRAAIARGKGIKRLTIDHTEGQRLFEAGKLTAEELFSYPRKHILESALGDREAPTIDHFEFDFLPGDRIIVSTDGVHNLVLLREMRELIADSSNPTELVRRISSVIEKRGATDNYSLITIFIDQ